MVSFFSLIYETLSYDLHRPSQTSIIGEHLRHLRQKFSERTDAIKEIIHQPPDYENESGGKQFESLCLIYFNRISIHFQMQLNLDKKKISQDHHHLH